MTMTPEQRAEAQLINWTDARLRGIASDYFPDPQHWPAAILCLRHMLMEQSKAAAQQAPAEPVTLPDVLDALNLFNRPKTSEGDGPWEGGHFIRVDHLPDFINIIAAAWFTAPPARQPLSDGQLYALWDAYTPAWPAGVTLQDFVQIARICITADRGTEGADRG